MFDLNSSYVEILSKIEQKASIIVMIYASSYEYIIRVCVVLFNATINYNSSTASCVAWVVFRVYNGTAVLWRAAAL